jgi:hypothetical protein
MLNITYFNRGGKRKRAVSKIEKFSTFENE